MGHMGQTAIVLGSTGLVGGELIKVLLADPRFDRVVALTRRKLPIEDPKLEAQVLDFEQPTSWKIAGDVLFSALGTTIKKAGSKEAQYKVDYTYQFEVAKAAAAAGVATYVLVSSMGANDHASSFYMRIKGELDRDVQKLAFARIRIARPGMLIGDRQEERLGEKYSGWMLNVLGAVPGLGAIKPIEGQAVARALVKAALDQTAGTRIYGARELHALGRISG